MIEISQKQTYSEPQLNWSKKLKRAKLRAWALCPLLTTINIGLLLMPLFGVELSALDVALFTGPCSSTIYYLIADVYRIKRKINHE